MKPNRVPFWIHGFKSTHRRLQANLYIFTNFQMTRSSENKSENNPSLAFTQWRRMVESPFPYNWSRKLYSRKICSKGLSRVSKCISTASQHHNFIYSPLITQSRSPNNANRDLTDRNFIYWQSKIQLLKTQNLKSTYKFRPNKNENPLFKSWRGPKPPQITYKIFYIHLLHGLISSSKHIDEESLFRMDFYYLYRAKILARFAHGKQAKKNK